MTDGQKVAKEYLSFGLNPVPVSENKEPLREKHSTVSITEKEIEDALAKAELVRQSILKKAFSGQLVIRPLK